MRKFKLMSYWLSAILLFTTSCTKEPVIPQSTDEKSLSTWVSPEQAQANLEHFLNEVAPTTRSGKKREIANMYILGGFGNTRTSDADEPLVYLFNFTDNEGYSLVSGDTRVPEVLAFIEHGNLDPEIGTNNPGLAIFLEQADNYYRIATGLPVYNHETQQYNTTVPFDPDDIRDDILQIVSYKYSPWVTNAWLGPQEIIPTQWDQISPYNKYCYTTDGKPAFVGCVAVAVGQLMYYHKKDCTYNGINFRWDQMQNATDAFVGTEASLDLVAQLLFQLGRPQNLDINYGAIADSEGSFAYHANVPRTFTNFGYSKGGTYADYDVITGLNYGPIYVCAAAKKKTIQHKFLGINTWQEISYHEGHAWVISHKIYQTRTKYTYRNFVLYKTEQEQREYVHCNWGWGGSDDGYYLNEVFDPCHGPQMTPETKATTTWEGESCYYRFDMKMIYDIQA